MRKTMSFTSTVKTIIKRYFISGLLVVVPLIFTYLVLKFLFEVIDGILQPLIFKLAGFYIPGLGVITTLGLVIVFGILTHNYIGNKLYQIWENILGRVPIIRPVYSAAKQLLESTTTSSTGSFQEVVMIEYPRKGAFVIGFVANRMEIENNGVMGKYASVFVPNPPTPFAGIAVVLPIDEIQVLDLTIEQALKFVVSAGVVSPQTIHRKGALTWEKPKRVIHETR